MQNRRILLVEDDNLIRWWMTNCLTSEGFGVIAPSTFKEALESAAQGEFDILISDWRLGDGHNGWEILAAVPERRQKISSVMISAEADEQLTKRSLALGFDLVLLKPLNSRDLIVVIQSLIPRPVPQSIEAPIIESTPPLECTPLMDGVKICA